MIVEEGMGWNSREYKNYKPYQEPKKGYNWKDYFYIIGGRKVCHHCDIRKTGCLSPNHPRYFCKKDKKEIQTTLGDF